MVLLFERKSKAKDTDLNDSTLASELALNAQ